MRTLFYIGVAVSMTMVVFFGFERTFFLSSLYDEPHPLAAPETIFYVHGIISTFWMALLITQPALIHFGQFGRHRFFGRIGAIVAALTVVSGLWGALVAAARPEGFMGLTTSSLEFIAMIGFNPLMFGILVMLALYYRRREDFHKRLMLLATVNLLQAAVVRIPLDFIADGPQMLSFELPFIFILIIALWDFYSLRKIHPATLWGGLVIMLSLPVRIWISQTETWLSFAAWSVRLVQ